MATYDTDEELNKREQTAHKPDSVPSSTPGAQAEMDQLNTSFYRPERSDTDRNTGTAEPETSGGLYKPDAPDGGNKNGKAAPKGKKKKRRLRGGIVGMLVAALLGVGGVELASEASGPFQLVHDAQLMLHANHQNEDNSDVTVSKELRFALSGGNAGETRLGTLGSLLTNNTIKSLDKLGLQPEYGAKNIYKGFTIDTTNPASPYYQMDEAKVRAQLKTQGVTDGISVQDGKVSITSQGYFAKAGSEKALVSNLGVSKLGSAVRVRYLSKYGLVTWHPFKAIKGKISEAEIKLARAAWEKAREKFLQSGQSGAEIDATHAQTKDEKGNVTDTPGSDTVATQSDAQARLKAIAGSKSFKISGGLAAAVGLACTVHAVAEHVHVITYADAILPASRVAWDVITSGEQIMSGHDVDIGEVGIAAGDLYDSVSQTSFDSGKPFNPSGNGPDMDSNTKDLLAGKLPVALAWSVEGPMNDLCSGVGTAVTTTVSVVVGVMSGGILSTAAGFAAGAMAGPGIIDYLSKMVSGETVNALAKGGEHGVIASYGSHLNANMMAIQNGGTIASPTTVSRLQSEQDKQDNAEFHSKSLAYRLFNPSDNRTLISHIIDNSSTSTKQNLAILATGFAHMGSTLLRMPAMLLSGIAHADGTTTYTYPFPTYLEPDANSPAMLQVTSDPDSAASVLENNPDLIDRAKQCFNDSIVKDANNQWDVVPGASSDVNAYDVYDPTTYNPSHCADEGNQDWSIVKAFIMATSAMESYACPRIGDNQSCTNDGFTNVDAQGNPVSAQMQANEAALAYQSAANHQAPIQPLLESGANQTVASVGRLLGALF